MNDNLPFLLQRWPFFIFNWGNLIGGQIALQVDAYGLAVFFYLNWFYLIGLLLWQIRKEKHQ